MTDESLNDIINSDLWKEKNIYLGDGIYSCKIYGDTYLIIPGKAGLLFMGADFHILTNIKHRGKKLAEKLIRKYIDIRKPKICGPDEEGYIPNASCSTGCDGCDEKSQPIIEHLLKKCGFKFTDSIYIKPHGGEGGSDREMWRYFYDNN